MRRGVCTIVFCFVTLLLFAQDSETIQDTVVSNEVVVTTKASPRFSIIEQKNRVDVRKVPQEEIDNRKRSDDYWYADVDFKKKEEQKAAQTDTGKSFTGQAWFRNLLWVLILGSFITVVIWYLASSNIRLFRKKSRAIHTEGDEEIDDEDLFSIQYEKEISKAVLAKNYRLAIRIWYLQILKELTDHSLIAYRPDKTNSDYVNSLFGTKHYQRFFRLTRHFEYIWYGNFPLTEEGYDGMRNEFATFKRELAK